MLTIILAAALLAALAGLCFEIGIASWTIREMKRYTRKALADKREAERTAEERMLSVSNFANRVLRAIDFLYVRYNKFADLENELSEGLKEADGDTDIGEADSRYRNLEGVMKIIRLAVSNKGLDAMAAEDKIAAEYERNKD
jgi:hypothetical protein